MMALIEKGVKSSGGEGVEKVCKMFGCSGLQDARGVVEVDAGAWSFSIKQRPQ